MGHFRGREVQKHDPDVLQRYRDWLKADADAAILVYDLTNISTLDGVEYYKEALEDNGPEEISKYP